MAAAAAAAVAAVANVAKPAKARAEGADTFSKELPSGTAAACLDVEIPGWTTVEQPSRHIILTNVFFEESTALKIFAEYGDVEFVSSAYSLGAVVVSYYDLRSAQYAKEVIQCKLRKNGAEIYFASPNQHGAELNNGTLVVFNLASSVTNEDLCSLFSTYGTVKEVRENPHNRNHRFVEYHDVRSAEAALTGLNGGVLKGKHIRVQLSQATGEFHKRRFSSAKCGKDMVPSPFGAQLSTPVTDPPSVLPFAGNVFNTAHSVRDAITAHHAAWYTAQRVSEENLCHDGQRNSGFSMKQSEAFSADIAIHGVLETQSSRAPHKATFCSPAGPTESTQLGFKPPQPVSGIWATAFSQGPRELAANPSEQMYSASQYLALGVPALTLEEQISSQGVFVSPNLNENLQASLVGATSVDAYASTTAGLKYWTASQSNVYPVSSFPVETPVAAGGGSHQSSNHVSLELAASNRLSEDRVRSRLVQADKVSPVLARGASGGKSNCHKKETVPQSAVSSVAAPRTLDPFELDLQKVMAGRDNRTALMIRNIPNKYTQDMLLAIINKNHKGQYDFFYLPIDFRNKCNVGYAFINMTSPKHVVSFHLAFHKKKWEHFNSEKITGISYARIQTRSALIAHFQNSSLLHEDKCCRPVLFDDAGEQ
eukprot:gene12437-14694_t